MEGRAHRDVRGRSRRDLPLRLWNDRGPLTSATSWTSLASTRAPEWRAGWQRLYEFGEYNWETFIVKRASIREEEQRLREQADVHKHDDDLEWCDRQILDLIQVWDLADSSQRARMVAGIFTEIEANTLANGQVNLVAVPRPSWKPSSNGW